MLPPPQRPPIIHLLRRMSAMAWLIALLFCIAAILSMI
jgi:hypothetical protein